MIFLVILQRSLIFRCLSDCHLHGRFCVRYFFNTSYICGVFKKTSYQIAATKTAKIRSMKSFGIIAGSESWLFAYLLPALFIKEFFVFPDIQYSMKAACISAGFITTNRFEKP